MLNKKNPAFIKMNFENKGTRSSIIQMADKIAILSHGGDPKFKNNNITEEDRNKLFDEAHPMVKGDLNVKALEIIRRAIIAHVHGGSAIPPDKEQTIKALEELDFSKMLSFNIVIN
jgi:hypothetical protein